MEKTNLKLILFWSRIILIAFLLAGIIPFALNKPSEVLAYDSLISYTISSDGYLYTSGSSYSYIWGITSSVVNNTGTSINIGQKESSGTYNIYRAALYFDTASIPDDATIISATLNLYGYQDYSTTDFDITIQNGQPTYPHDPLIGTDYFKDRYSGDGGTLNSSNFTVGAYNSISLNATGLSWISVNSTTKLFLRSSLDIAGSSPSDSQYVIFYSSEYGAVDPYLTVYYAVAPSVTTNTATSVTSVNATLNGNITSLGGDNVTSRGFQWGTASGSYTDNWTEAGDFAVGTFSHSMSSNLTDNTTYYFRALAVNSIGTSYGDELSFFTPDFVPTIAVVTDDAVDVSTTSTTLQGQLQSLGGVEYAVVGFQYGTTTSYGTTIGEQAVVSTGIFTIDVSGLRYNTTYHFRAFARYGTSYFYGADITFTTLETIGSSTDLDIVSVAVFQSFLEDGDILVCVETINTYTGYYPTKKAGTWFTIQLLDETATDVLAASPLSAWGDRPSSIYINATQAGDLVEGSAYYVRMIGENIDGDPSVSYQLTVDDWRGYDLTTLDDWCVGVVMNMQVSDSRSDYLTVLVGYGVAITDEAGGYFDAGVPGLAQTRPNLFESYPMSVDYEIGTASNTWDSTTAWQTNVGSIITADSVVLALPFGITGKDFLAGLIMLVILGFVMLVAGAAGGFGALGAVLIAVPFLWLGTYFEIIPAIIILMVALFFGAMFIRQFVVKTL